MWHNQSNSHICNDFRARAWVIHSRHTRKPASWCGRVTPGAVHPGVANSPRFSCHRWTSSCVCRGVHTIQTRQMPTTATTTDALWKRWREQNDLDARRELLSRYIGLVHHAAREVAPRVRDAVSLDELFSAGSLGLLQAMEGFDTDRGLAFSTFAMRRIRGAILDELRS